MPYAGIHAPGRLPIKLQQNRSFCPSAGKEGYTYCKQIKIKRIIAAVQSSVRHEIYCSQQPGAQPQCGWRDINDNRTVATLPVGKTAKGMQADCCHPERYATLASSAQLIGRFCPVLFHKSIADCILGRLALALSRIDNLKSQYCRGGIVILRHSLPCFIVVDVYGISPLHCK